MSRIILSICDSQNFERLFKAHSKVVRSYIYYKCGDMELTEDIVQDAFVTLWQNCHKVTYNEALFYLKRVAYNNYLNMAKHQKVVLKFNQSKVDEMNIETPEFKMEEQEFMQRLQKAVSALPEKQREVFLLNRIDKMTYKEIAHLLELSVKAVEKRMSQALIALREQISQL